MIWKITFMAIFAVWFLLRLYFARGTKGQTSKNTCYPQSEKYMVFLNADHHDGSCLLMIVFTSWLDRFSMDLPSWLRVSAAIVMAASVCLFAWTHYSLGKFWSPILEIRDRTPVDSDWALRLGSPSDVFTDLDMGSFTGGAFGQLVAGHFRNSCLDTAILCPTSTGRKDDA